MCEIELLDIFLIFLRIFVLIALIIFVAYLSRWNVVVSIFLLIVGFGLYGLVNKQIDLTIFFTLF